MKWCRVANTAYQTRVLIYRCVLGQRDWSGIEWRRHVNTDYIEYVYRFVVSMPGIVVSLLAEEDQ